MSSIILDCDLMNHPNSGLYHYCLNIGLRVNQQLERERKEPMKMYVPKAEKFSFAKPSHTIVEKSWHKFFKPFMIGCKVWHAPFQSGRIVPDKKSYPDVKVLLTIHDLNPLHEGKPLEEQKKSIAHTQSLIDRSDAIVCISAFTKADVLQNCNTGNKPLYVIHNGIHRVNIPSQTNRRKKIERRLFWNGYKYKTTTYYYHC